MSDVERGRGGRGRASCIGNSWSSKSPLPRPLSWRGHYSDKTREMTDYVNPNPSTKQHQAYQVAAKRVPKKPAWFLYTNLTHPYRGTRHDTLSREWMKMTPFGRQPRVKGEPTETHTAARSSCCSTPDRRARAVIDL